MSNISSPITLFIFIAGVFVLRNNKPGETGKVDGLGILTLVAMILSLLYGLKNLDFFNIAGTIGSLDAYPFLTAFIVLIPAFILVENRAQDPVMNLGYFSNRNIVFTLLISFVSGFVLMGVIFIPQFSENALKIATGSGGYLVIILGIFSGIGAPHNYMMLANTDEKESNSALATLSLVRSIGTVVAPAIMVGFLAHAGASIQTDVMDLLPKEVSLPELPYVQEISDALDQLKDDPNMQEKFQDMEMPDLAAMRTMEINMNGDSDFAMPADLVDMMKNSDVTTITQNAKTLASRMFDLMIPDVITKIQDGIGQGIEGMNAAIEGQKTGLDQLNTISDMLNTMGNPEIPQDQSLADMIPSFVKSKIPQEALDEMAQIHSAEELSNKIDALNTSIDTLTTEVADAEKSRDDMKAAMDEMSAAVSQMQDLQTEMEALKDAIPSAFDQAEENYLASIDDKALELESAFQKTLNKGFGNVYLTSAIAALLALIMLAFYTNTVAVKARREPQSR